MSSRALPRLVPLILSAASLVGCKSAAISEVVSSAIDYHAYLRETPARLDVPEVNEFLGTISDNLLKAALSRRGEEEEGASKLDPYDEFDVVLVQSVAPNAATPGDNCAKITTRLFLEAEHPEQVVAVLAHELGHIVGLHQVTTVHRRMKYEFAMGVVTGLGAGLDGYNAAQMPGYQVQDWGGMYRDAMAAYKPWDKEDEFDADRIGLELYMELGLAPDRYVSLFRLLGEKWGDDDSETHPRPSERARRLEEQLSAQEPQSYASLSIESFRKLQLLVAEEVCELADRGLLQGDETAYAQALREGRSESQVSCCGSLEYDWEDMSNSFVGLVGERLTE